MRRFLSYMKYILIHKWWVLVAGARIGAPLWRLLIHDMSKLLPSEWNPYAQTFYSEIGDKQYKPCYEFDYAWLFHQRRNKHHWQYWLLKEDNGNIKALEMPEKYSLEMLADWMGAGKAITGKWEYKDWYTKNQEKIILNERTRRFIEQKIYIYS